MGTPIRTPDSPDVQEGLDAATRDLAARMSGKSAPPPDTAPPPETPPPSETPPATETPAEPPATPTPAAEPGADGVGAPEPPPSPVPPPASERFQSPAAKRFLEMYGGDEEKALEAALGYNNRLSALAKAHPELFVDGAPADPNAPPPEITELFQEPEVEPALPEDYLPDEEAIMNEVNRWVDRDPQCRQLMHTFAQNEAVINEKKAERDSIKADIEYKQRLMKDEAFSPDDVRKADLQAEVQGLRFEAGNLDHEIRGLESDNRQMDETFISRRSQAWDSIAEQMEQTAAEEAIEREATQYENQVATEDRPKWLAALNRAVESYKIPADQVPYFKEDAKVQALAYLADEEANIEDYDAFLAPIARRSVERIDAAHRTQAAVYGAQAHTRAETPAPPSPPGTATPPAEGPPDLDSIMQESQRMLRERMRG